MHRYILFSGYDKLTVERNTYGGGENFTASSPTLNKLVDIVQADLTFIPKESGYWAHIFDCKCMNIIHKFYPE